jgi:VWFA-related protein
MSIRHITIGLLTVGLLVAQETQQPPPRPDITVEYNFVTAPVTVLDDRGKTVAGLTALDFQLFDNGAPQTLTEDVTTHPISLVVVVQASTNMEQMLPNIRKIGSLFTPYVLGEGGEVAVIAFDHRIQTMTGFTSDPDKISEAFKKIKAGSGSNHLNDAADNAIFMLRTRPPTRRRIMMLIAETRDYGSAVTIRDVLTNAEFANIVVYSVEVSHFLTSLTAKTEPPRPNPVPPESRLPVGGVIATQTTDAQQNMGNYAPIFREIFIAAKAIFRSNPQEVYTKFTGGHEYSYKTQKGLEQAVAEIGNEVHSQYLLTYLPTNRTEGGYHEIEVKVLKQGLTVRTRAGYWIAPRPN